MTYRLNNELKKIKSPVCIVSPMKLKFENGEELCDYDFDKYYLIDSISARERKYYRNHIGREYTDQ